MSSECTRHFCSGLSHKNDVSFEESGLAAFCGTRGYCRECLGAVYEIAFEGGVHFHDLTSQLSDKRHPSRPFHTPLTSWFRLSG